MQAYRIKNQCNNFYEYVQLAISKNTGIPENVLNDIRSKALIEWAKNPEIGDKCDILAGLPLLDCLYSTVNTDWEMVMYQVNKQIDAYKSLY